MSEIYPPVVLYRVPQVHWNEGKLKDLISKTRDVIRRRGKNAMLERVDLDLEQIAAEVEIFIKDRGRDFHLHLIEPQPREQWYTILAEIAQKRADATAKALNKPRTAPILPLIFPPGTIEIGEAYGRLDVAYHLRELESVAVASSALAIRKDIFQKAQFNEEGIIEHVPALLDLTLSDSSIVDRYETRQNLPDQELRAETGFPSPKEEPQKRSWLRRLFGAK